MNIDIANRLINLRKEKGYTQESLADALGISRQAVSKWERAEASPDTDNLICLAKLYGVSLDEILSTDETVEELREEKIEEEFIKQGKNGIHIKSGDDEVHISMKGINVTSEDGDNVHIGFDGIKINDNKKSINITNHENEVRDILYASISLIAVVSYIVLGFTLNLWHPAWLIFLLIPVVESIVEIFLKKKITVFCYPVAVTATYLFLGFTYSLWHPYWVLFITIPVFYMVFNPIDKLINKE